jgi:transcriptional regulator GlxA family with amidase domain
MALLALLQLPVVYAGDLERAKAPTMLTAPASGSIKVAFVLSENATVIDFAGPWEVFQDTDAKIPFELYTVAPEKSPLHTSGNGRHGMTITPDYTFADAPEPDVVVIGAQSGGAGLSEWLQKIHRDRKVIVSVCTGAFKVAQAGLLDGRPATTHHEFTDQLARDFPKVNVVRSVRYVQSEPLIYTAGGLTSGVDLALHIVDGYFGREVAQKTADYMEYQSTAWKTP